MVKVFFESSSHAEEVATFATEELYMICLPMLKIRATKERMTVNERIEEEPEEELNLSNVTESIKMLPEFLENVGGFIITGCIGGADVTEEWNDYLKLYDETRN